MSRAWSVVVVALALLTTLAGPAAAASPSPSPSPSVSAGATPSASPRGSEQLQREADERSAAVDAGVARQQAATRAATEALEAYQAAARAADVAGRQAAAQARLLAVAAERTETSRVRLGRYVGSVYRTGVGDPKLAAYSSLMDTRNPQQLFRGLGMVSRVGGNSGDAFVALERAQAVQAQAKTSADTAAAAAAAASKGAAAAKAEADEVVAAAVQQVAEASAALARTQSALGIAQEREELVARATALARQRAAVPYAAIEGALAERPVGECKGGELRGHANGQLPTAALCPLWGTSGMLLRADAAAAFDAMSQAYGAEFGEPICVTDSYRSLPEQVAVAAAKPTLAAVPGTSNHGWGVALDLCGGIQSFGTPQHAWLVANSMAYGWFLPSWAQADGSKPEAWHWEFAL